MTDGLGTDLHPPQTDHLDETPGQPVSEATLWRTLAFLGVAALSAGLIFALVRAAFQRTPSDPAAERIQSLIDEANRLLKQLDEQKRA